MIHCPAACVSCQWPRLICYLTSLIGQENPQPSKTVFGRKCDTRFQVSIFPLIRTGSMKQGDPEAVSRGHPVQLPSHEGRKRKSTLELSPK